MSVGIGIFGSGNLSQFVIKVLTKNGFPVEGIWDLSKEVAQQASILLKIPYFTDSIDSLLLNAKISLIVIVCPPHFHHQIITKALRIGKHVICDNLIGSPKQLKEVIFASNYYPSLISLLSFPFRFLSIFNQVRTLLSKDSIGYINLINANVNTNCFDLNNWYGIKCDEWMGGGLLQTIGVHFIDIISFITNLKAKRVHGVLKKFEKFQQKDQNDNHTTRVDDFCSFQMEMINAHTSSSFSSILANVTITSYLLDRNSYEIIIIGTLGYLAIRDNQLFLKMFNQFENLNHSKEHLILKEDYDSSLPSSDYLPKSYTQGLTQMIVKLKKTFETQTHFSIIKNEAKKENQLNSDQLKFDQESIIQRPNGQVSIGPKFGPWYKEILKEAATFEDGRYAQSVIDSIKASSMNKEWVRVKHSFPKTLDLSSKGMNGH